MSTSTLTRPSSTETRTVRVAAAPSVVDLVRAASVATRTVVSSYRTFAAWRDLALQSVLLVYGAGAFFFWLHGVARGEHGPAIAYWQHWVLDSTIGFLALTPVLAVALPLLKQYSVFRFGAGRVPAGFIAATLGVLFAFVTAPGPIVHNLLAGEGKPLARWAEHLFGIDPAVAHHYATTVPHTNAAIEVALQVGFGIPVYMTAAVVAVVLGRAIGRRSSI